MPYHVVEGDEPLWSEAVERAIEMGDDLGLEPPRPEPELTIEHYGSAIQNHVDAAAQARSYDSGITCSSYVNSTNPGWAAEAEAFVAWRDAVWTYAYGELAKVEGGQRPQPSVAEIIDELPSISWPLGSCCEV
ncbi:hypothetical protein B5U98_29405 [Bosea sp. Tri-39]|nr:hypothetical protein BLM15_19990 [Bosea sp. Tri-49]RXT16441.1 hypothetical protein B5U98_29405 [Bosea sp. Tri-39]RXT40142.1 hypothetical protein B5U99_06450 [Bosea sp. Tri-54]